MPLFDSLAVGTVKSAVIFDIGHAYTKCGFASEVSPRAIIPTTIIDKCIDKSDNHERNIWTDEDPEELNKNLVNFFHNLYFRHLHVSSKYRCVLLVESVLSTTDFREKIASVLFKHFEVPSILFAPAHLLALFTLGTQTGLVLDCGYEEALVLPVFEGHLMLKAWQAAPLAGQRVHRVLKKQLIEQAECKNCKTPMEMEDIEADLTEDIIEDLKVRACFVTPLERARARLEAELDSTKSPPAVPEPFLYPLPNGITLSIPAVIRETACECLFQMDSEETSVASLILDALLSCTVDVRRPLAENLVLIGGTCQLPGFKARLKAELDDLLTLDKYAVLSTIKDSIKFHNPPAQPNFVAWLGGAIFGDLEVLPLRSVAREVYLARGVMPDWASLRVSLGSGLPGGDSMDGGERTNIGR